jgi:lysyl-tRNA synthetase class II
LKDISSLANAHCTDPLVTEQRIAQVAARDASVGKTQMVDHDYIAGLEYGLPSRKLAGRV